MSTQYYLYEPFFSISDFQRLFDDAVNTRTASNGNNNNQSGHAQHARRHDRDDSHSPIFQPQIDVHESEKENLVTATFDLPGMKKEDITIDVHNNRLIVSGEVKHANDAEKGAYIVHERRHGKFSRTLPLPAGAQPEQIKAGMEHGVLTVTFPKSSPEQSAKRITIL